MGSQSSIWLKAWITCQAWLAWRVIPAENVIPLWLPVCHCSTSWLPEQLRLLLAGRQGSLALPIPTWQKVHWQSYGGWFDPPVKRQALMSYCVVASGERASAPAADTTNSNPCADPAVTASVAASRFCLRSPSALLRPHPEAISPLSIPLLTSICCK
jgi:hypothetical protein